MPALTQHTLSPPRRRPALRPLSFAVCSLLAIAACGPRTMPTDVIAQDATDAPTALDAPPDTTTSPLPIARHSSSIAVSPDGRWVYVVNADNDSVSVIDTSASRLQREIALSAAPPSQDPTTHRFEPAIGPRALALSPRAQRLYVAGNRSSDVLVIDLASAAVMNRIAVGSEPAGLVVSPDERSVFVACAQDATVVRIDTATAMVTGTAHTAWKPWALAWSTDGAALFVSHLLGPGVRPGPSVSVIDPGTMSVSATWVVPSVAYRGNDLLAYGEVRGLYDLAMRPTSAELWSVHLLLATQTAQVPTSPGAHFALRFNTTVFPALSALSAADGSLAARLSTYAPDVPGANGEIGDVVSGPHAIEFTADGRFALVLDTNSEDVMIIDATRRFETNVRRLPGHMPEGIVMAPDGVHAYVDERNTADVAVLTLQASPTDVTVSPDVAQIARLAHDAMPAQLRTGQRVFHSANSVDIPITTDHWVACASCHIEGRSDAVVWRFEPGPRDTPSNAGGVSHTGFLFHTADRRAVRDYWHTINVEQGGNFTATDPMLSPLLDALEAYVNLAIPLPVPPHTDGARVARGNAIFHRGDVGCAGCHSGQWFTDSGEGNAMLSLSGPVLLHDVGTCNTSAAYPDVAHTDDDGNARVPCLFDTPTLRGVSDSAPYFHDGSAATLREALELTRGRMGDIRSLSSSDLDDLVEYLRSL